VENLSTPEIIHFIGQKKIYFLLAAKKVTFSTKKKQVEGDILLNYFSLDNHKTTHHFVKILTQGTKAKASTL